MLTTLNTLPDCKRWYLSIHRDGPTTRPLFALIPDGFTGRELSRAHEPSRPTLESCEILVKSLFRGPVAYDKIMQDAVSVYECQLSLSLVSRSCWLTRETRRRREI
ncbi:hypothetical protein LshimejAT787_0703950 [Lyophyllum shimeji]|uniref:Uncharacterized protein n=1 Tax=Lyophyllum shimeji TaxID=47721 RepID=A0A9P3PNV1_LYOSH|nr:hypothetical protein LshimejAT787_0703950 [Lyophyllum shimeji]